MGNLHTTPAPGQESPAPGQPRGSTDAAELRELFEGVPFTGQLSPDENGDHRSGRRAADE